MSHHHHHDHDDYSMKTWLSKVKAYKKPVFSKSMWQVINSFVPLIVLWMLSYFALQQSFWLMLAPALLAGCFVVRIFIIQHDCGHGSFFKNKKLQDWVGRTCSLTTLTPYYHWKMEHSIHHAHSGDLDHRDIGEIDTYTVEEFLHLSKGEKFWYRVMRNPFFLFLVAPIIQFGVLQRFPKGKHDLKNKKMLMSIVDTNLALLGVVIVVSSFIGWKDYFIVQGLISYAASSLGVWLFYVQHQFEDGYWYHKPEWNMVQSALHGSSYFKLPKLLQWFTGNIGYHHIHHLSPQIPNYELERCHNDHPEFDEEVTTLTLKNCWCTMKLRLWDEKKKTLVSMKELYQDYKPRFEAVSRAMEKLKYQQEVMLHEVSEMKDKLAEYSHNGGEIRKRVIENQMRTLQKMLKKRSARKEERIKALRNEIEVLKQSVKLFMGVKSI